MILSILFFLLGAVETDTFMPFPSGVSLQESNGMLKTEFSRDEGFLSGEPGAPLLPLISRVFILPGVCEVSDPRVSLEFPESPNGSGYSVPAAQAVRPVGGTGMSPQVPSTIGINGEAPLVSVHSGTILNSATIVSLSINPWRYEPLSGELSLAVSCTAELNWTPAGTAVQLSRLQAETVNYRLQQIAADNGAVFTSAVRGSDAAVDYLIITGDSFSDELAPLVNLLEYRSYTVELVTVDDIGGSWSGIDLQEDIRNCISYYALNQGTTYVLLAGDENVVPPRDVYMECEGLIETAPCDLYYADLDGSWDGNGNGIYGEYEDSLDLYADVILGRLLFSTPESAETIVQKNLEYSADSSSDWYRQAVLCGAQLFPDVGYTGAKGCEMTAGFFPPDYDLVRAYEIEVGDYSDTYLPVIYGGAGWNHYAGHGNDRGVYWGDFRGIMSVSKMDGFSNQGRYGIHSSIGCHTGDFTDPGTNLCDTLLTQPDGGGIACFFNTTWGWEGFWPDIGSSERLCLNTVQQVYQQKALTLGLAYTVAKDLEIPMMTGPYDRVMQSVLAYSAFTEPSLEVLGVESSNPFPPQPFRIIMQGPNPVTSESLAFKVTGMSDAYDVSVYNIAGRKVMETFSLGQNTLHSLLVDDLVPGVYFLSARSPGGSAASASFVRLR